MSCLPSRLKALVQTPPALTKAPLPICKGLLGLVVPIPTLPVLVMITRWTFAVANRREGFGATAEASGRTLKKPEPRPNEDPE